MPIQAVDPGLVHGYPILSIYLSCARELDHVERIEMLLHCSAVYKIGQTLNHTKTCAWPLQHPSSLSLEGPFHGGH